MRSLAFLPLLLVACGADPPAVGKLPEDRSLDAGGAGGAGGSGGAGGGAAGAAGATAGGGEAGASAGGAAGGCSVPAEPGLEVAQIDLYRYPSYAVDGCSLVYVAPAAGGRELRLRSMATGGEEVIAPASEEPSRPTMAGDVIAWEARIDGKRSVRVRAGGATTTLSGGFDHAGEPRAAADAVVFVGWSGADETSDTGVYLYEVASGASKLVAEIQGQQRFPDVSASHVAFSSFDEDPDGTLSGDANDLADIILVERATGAVTVHARPGKQAFPLLGSEGSVVYLDWPVEHPEPKFQAYGVRSWEIGAQAEDRVLFDVVSSFPEVMRPSTRGGVVEWVGHPDGGGAVLYRAALGGEVTQVSGLDAFELFAPVTTPTHTLLASRPEADPGAPATLRFVAR